MISDHELITLQDYRQRYCSYRLDPDLIRVHPQYPFYNICDDHETVHNSWYSGADAHDLASEGDWFILKTNGQQAFFEWLPIRPKAPGGFSIYRSFHFGTSADFILLDTLLEGRDEQAPLLDQAAYADTGGTILGAVQRQWLLSQLSD